VNGRVCREPPTAFAASLALIVAVASAACQSVTPQLLPVPKVTPTAAAFAAFDGPAGVGGAIVIDDNTRVWAARWEFVTDARRQIDLATFIYGDDIFGLALLGALTERASAGVQVRLLLDGRGSLAMTSPLLGRDLLQELAATGHADIHVCNTHASTSWWVRSSAWTRCSSRGATTTSSSSSTERSRFPVGATSTATTSSPCARTPARWTMSTSSSMERRSSQPSAT
jgi:hypothetical protein